MQATPQHHERLDYFAGVPPETNMSAIPKRKPLPLSAAPLHSQDLPVHHDSEDDSEDDQETPLVAPPIPIRLKAATDGSAVLRTPLLSDDQLRPRTSFSEGKVSFFPRLLHDTFR